MSCAKINPTLHLGQKPPLEHTRAHTLGGFVQDTWNRTDARHVVTKTLFPVDRQALRRQCQCQRRSKGEQERRLEMKSQVIPSTLQLNLSNEDISRDSRLGAKHLSRNRSSGLQIPS